MKPWMHCPACDKLLLVGAKCPGYDGPYHRSLEPRTRREAMALGKLAAYVDLKP